MITFENVSHYYGQQKALEKVSLTLGPGQFCALLGHNGAGKSTLMRLMAGVDGLQQGQGNLFGHKLGEDIGAIRTQLAYVSEGVEFLFPLAMKEFVQTYQRLWPNWDEDFFAALCDRLRLDLLRPFETYSRGQKMQMALVMALARRPKALFIDEVTSVLDVYARNHLMQILDEFVKDGALVVMATNIIHEVENHAGHFALLSGGQLAAFEQLGAVERRLAKVRKTALNHEHPLFTREDLFWVGKNSDGSHSYIMQNQAAGSLEEVADKRRITLSEMFLYFNNRSLEE